MDETAPRVVPLTAADAGEVLTLQRAAFVAEAQLYDDPFLPPLTETLEELRADLAGPALGLRDGTRLIGTVRWRLEGAVARIGRLAIAPDRQGEGWGAVLLRAAERASGASSFELFTGHLSEGNLRLYERQGYVEVRRQRISDAVELVHLVRHEPVPGSPA